MDRILFLIPPYVSCDNFVNPAFNERIVIKKCGTFGSVATDMPIGLLSISSYLKENISLDIKLVDFNVVLNKLECFVYKSFKELYYDILTLSEWTDYNPTIIGISALFTPTYFNMLDLAEICRQLFPGALITAGGGVPTNMYPEIFRDSSSFDALCYGEGENPMLGLVRAANKEQYINNSQSWITKDKYVNGVPFRHDFVNNLDDIPFYDYNLLNPTDYSLSPIVNNYTYFKGNNTIFHLATSRGCPNLCCYCSSHTVHGRKIRSHSSGRIKDDISTLKKRYGAKTIIFQDDQFLFDNNRALDIIEYASKLQLKIFFQSGLALNKLDREFLEKIRKMGISSLVLAIESGSDRVLKDIMHKPLTTKTIRRVVDDCRDLGIETDAMILIGLPGETKQDIEDTREFLKTISPNWYRVFIATPLVGSDMYKNCIKNNYLNQDFMTCDFKRAVIETEDFSAGYIMRKAYLLNLELNFVENNDIKLGNYEIALRNFENVINVKNDHAFAYYYAALCYKMLNQLDKSNNYLDKAGEIIKNSDSWREYSNIFKLPIAEEIFN